jgi:Uma2 family endonuclease
MTTLRDQLEDPPEYPPEDDLPDSDGIPMDSERQALQMNLLAQSAKHYFRDRPDVYVGANMFIYFSPDQLMTYDFRGPDVFIVTGTTKKERRRWVCWLEEKGPDLVIEILSSTTRAVDMTLKKEIYQDKLRVPEYFWYDPFTGELAGWVLFGKSYQPIAPDERGGLPSHVTGLTLTSWTGIHEHVEAPWLRWATPDGVIVPSPWELANAARERAVQAQERAEQAQERAEQAEQLASEARAEAERERQLRAELEARLAALERERR